MPRDISLVAVDLIKLTFESSCNAIQKVNFLGKRVSSFHFCHSDKIPDKIQFMGEIGLFHLQLQIIVGKIKVRT